MPFQIDQKQQLCNAFVSLMQEMPLEKITIQKIVDRCGVTRTTFYHYFQDKYDVLSYTFCNEVESLAQNCQSYHEFVFAVCRMMESKCSFFKQAFLYEGQNSIYNSICAYNMDAVCSKYRKEEPQRVEQDTFRYLALGYSVVVTSIFRHWVQSGMKESSEKISEIILESCPSIIANNLLLQFESTKECTRCAACYNREKKQCAQSALTIKHRCFQKRRRPCRCNPHNYSLMPIKSVSSERNV